ncbi:23S rRNA (uracil(1939)-C(5))-methyltransferase RlmD [Candidatus Bilamarchaeum dharawalense]|uniref:23S rRNA (Uracil(1939)-C(5))-methyltransferase RlmD n=1 Tax=Candidatus Bilamarchaeum dharawalense TaxID=2885759 RepID=A0A5E4LWV1_9ARCH|nr:23S rRNA (uracil(1939)-C(5))-methyltransferase RlmD [Candidatus Bilamarchaeum dharawalense]
MEESHKKYGVPKPVSVGDTLKVKIESQGGQGDGIAKIDGFIIFVKGAKKGEECTVKINDVKRTYAVAEKSSPNQPSEEEKEMDEEVEGTGGGPSG